MYAQGCIFIYKFLILFRDEMNASGVLFNNSEDTNDVKPPVTPLKPDPKLAPPKRPQKLFFNNPLSPIASSPENSPPGSPKLSRPKNLQIPTFLAKFNSSKDLNSSGISKMSRCVLDTSSVVMYSKIACGLEIYYYKKLLHINKKIHIV